MMKQAFYMTKHLFLNTSQHIFEGVLRSFMLCCLIFLTTFEKRLPHAKIKAIGPKKLVSNVRLCLKKTRQTVGRQKQTVSDLSC